MNKSAATSFLALFLLASLATAGSLTPPGSPASTMNTLAELFDSIVGGFDSTGVVADQNGSLIEHLKYIEANMPAGSGWTDDGTVVRLTTITDNVGIGTTTPNNRLQVAGLISFDDVNENTVLGSGAFSSNTGFGNTAIGYQALPSNTTGFANTAIGGYALNSNTTGYYNTAYGFQSLFSNTTGALNTAIGPDTLYANTTGNENTAIGRAALTSNTTGIENTALGHAALISNTTGSHNTASGVLALTSNTTGDNNVANGESALNFNTTGSFNTATGFQALSSNTTGDYNTANGADALFSNTTGFENVANGYRALYSNTTGIYNSAEGTYALFSNTTGSDNSAQGAFALYANTTGYYNSAHGESALGANTTGALNSAQGAYALANNTIGSYNTAQGTSALGLNTTGAYNSALGADALNSNITGDDNIAVGASAGYSALGSGNVFLGRSAGYLETGSNRLYIDNSSTATPLIYGEFDNDYLSFGANVSISGQLDVYSGPNRALRLAVDDASPFGLVINNLTHGSTDATGFGFAQDDDGTGYIGVDDLTNPLSIAANGRIIGTEFLGYITNPSDNRHAVYGIANITGDASLGSQDIVAAGGNISFQATSGTTDRATAGSFVTVADTTAAGTINNAIGLDGGVQALGTTNIVNAYAGLFSILASGASTLTNTYGINISSLQIEDAGTVENNYGLYINDQDGLATSVSYNLYSAGIGLNYFGGNVGIGVIEPGEALEIIGVASVSDNIRWGAGANMLNDDQGGSIELGGVNTNPVPGGSPFIDFHYGNGLGEDYNYRIRNAADEQLDFRVGSGVTMTLLNRRVGIGTGPTTLLHVASATFDGDIFRLQDSDGDCTVNPEAVTTFSCSSDRRLKEDIEDTQPILARIMDFRVRDFTMRSSGDHQTGVIAQEVQETWPDMVSMGASGYLKVEQPNPWLVIKAIQELNNRIDSLSSQGPIDFNSDAGFSGLFDRMVATFRDLLGIGFGQRQICLGDTCINEEQLQQLMQLGDIEPVTTPEPTPQESVEPTATPEVSVEPSPEITPESTPEATEPPPSDQPEIPAE